MPKHYALGQNVQHMTANFRNTKMVEITFDNAFTRKPMVQLTMNDSGNMPAYKTHVTTTGAKIRFQNSWTGEVDVLVTERT